MKQTYKYSYKVGDKLLKSLAVYNVGNQRCEPGYQWGPGVRDHYCIHHIIHGRGVYETNGRAYELEAGDTFILYPGTEVKYYADETQPWEYAWVGFTGSDAASILLSTDFSKEVPVIRQGVPSKEIRRQLGKIYKVKGNQYGDAVAMTGALYTLLAILVDCAVLQERSKDSRLEYVEKAMDYIATGYSYPISIEDVAAYVGISRSHLFRCFQMYAKQSPKEYLTDFRIKQACLLLKETGLPIATVAYSVGFENNLYFSKAFKGKMKMSPSQYRLSVR